LVGDKLEIHRRGKAHMAITEPHEGDWVIFPGDIVRRISYDWGDSVQTSDTKFGSSFYLGDGGFASFSGGLYSSIPKTELELTDEVREGAFWFFHNGESRAHNGV
jgi:hypothetical protein